MLRAKEKLKDILLNRFHAKIQYNGVWYNISCPFCGDSPNPKTRHCNIRLSPDDNAVIVYCFQLKCHASGVMNKKHLKDMGIYDKEIIDFIENNRASTQELMEKTYDTVHGWELPTGVNKIVADYFRNRTRLELTEDIIYKYRIVTSLHKFVELNKEKIGPIARDRILEVATKPYIGFLNSTGTNLEIRAAIKDIPKDLRFLKINLIENESLLRFVRHKPYTVEVENDYTLGENGYITILEGKFDAINVVERIMPDCKGIWISTPVAGMKSVVEEVTKVYPYRRLVFICDSDVKDNDIVDKIKDIAYRITSVDIVRNKASKDFGDLNEPIEPERYSISLSDILEDNTNIKRRKRNGIKRV